MTAWLSHRHLPLLAAVLAMLLCAPALGHGWYGDDWFHRAVLLDSGLFPTSEPLWSLFHFLSPESNALITEWGIFPWWGDADARARFLRPLSALTHVADIRLWPHSAPLQHLHSLLWLGAAVAVMGTAARAMLRDVAGPLAAGLAVVLYAIDDAHSTPAAWLANRNALVAITFGGAALLAHLRGTRMNHKAHWGLPVAVGLTAVALASAEAGLGAVAWIGAWELTCGRGSLVRRGARLLPYVLLIGVWRALYDHWDYGASGSGLYIDPGASPLVFAQALAGRWPHLAAVTFAPLPVDLWAALKIDQRAVALLPALFVLAGVGWLAWPLLRRRDAVGDRTRLALVGAAVCVVPPAAAFPMDRVVGFAILGAAMLYALLYVHGTATGIRRHALTLVLLVQGPISAVMLVAKVAALPMMGQLFGAGATGAPADPAIADQVLLYVNGTDFAAIYTPVHRHGEGTAPIPKRTALLTSCLTENTVARVDVDTLRITAKDGWLARGLDQLVRAPEDPLHLGDRIERPDFTATVEALTEDGRPATVRFDFVRPVDDPQHRWVAFEGTTLTPGHVVPWTPPAVGETVVLPWALPLR